MRLLIYILALTSAFFVSDSHATGLDLDNLLTPKSEEVKNKCFGPYGRITDTVAHCESAFQRAIDDRISSSRYVSDSGVTSKKINDDTVRFTFKYVHCGSSFDPARGCRNPKNFNIYNDYGVVELKSCPPNGAPKHIHSYYSDPQNDGSLMCAKSLEDEPEPEKDCPAGYHSKAVSKAMGSDSCMPKECPAAGSGEDLYSSKMTGGVPFDGGGMYCNDGCAYSVKSENVTSDQYALGVSQGAACGDKPYDNKKLSDEGDEGQCETNTVDGVTIMFCNNEPAPPTDKDDDANNDGSKEDETEKPKKDLEDCASDDNACMLRNLIKEQSNNTQVQIENDNKLHNKMVDTATNNTNVLKTAIDDFHTTVFVGLQKNDKLEAVKASKMNDLISAVREGNQILTDKPIGGGGGSGGGNGGGDGEGEGGGDCEGGAADCVPIAGSEIPKEIVNLSQYADKYDDWLPNAELPEEKCIVLTTGQSLCFSFSAFIILFQAISGLIVISSLLHSARIIAGAI